MKKIVLLGFWNWAPVLTFAKRWQELGVETCVMEVVLERGPAAPAFSCLGRERAAITWDELKSESGAAAVAAFAQKVHAEAIVSADESLLLWLTRHRSALEPACRVMAGPAEAYEGILSKEAQVAVAREAGFDVLESWFFTHADIAAEPAPNQYPICLRPTFPNSVEPLFKAKMVHSPAELRSFLASLTSITRPIVGQSFHVGPNLVVHGARDIHGNILAMEGFLAYRKFRGFALSIERVPLSPELIDVCSNFAANTGMVGIFHYDLLRSVASARTLFLEINPRMGGTTSKVVQLGYDEPLLALRCFGIATEVDHGARTPAARATGKRALVQHIVALLKNETSDLSYPVEGRWKSLSRSLYELAFVQGDQLINAKDPVNSVRYLMHNQGQ